MKITINWVTRDWNLIRRLREKYRLPQYMNVNGLTEAEVDEETLSNLRKGEPKVFNHQKSREMTRQESERKLNELRKKYIALISSMNFAKAQKIKNKIDSLERELEPHSLGELLQDYTPEFKVEMLRKMHKLFIYSDLLEGAALEFQSELESNGIDAQVVFQVKRVLKELRSIVRIPDEEKNASLSDNFAGMCDEAGLVVSNIINKYLANDNGK